MRSLALVIVAKIYDMIALYSTRLENRKQEDIYEMVMGVKVFIFRLISDFTAVIYSAIVTRDIYRLKTLLYTHIIIKYISEFGSRFFYPLFWNYFFKKIYFKKVVSKTKLYPIKHEDKIEDNNTNIKNINDNINLPKENQVNDNDIEGNNNQNLLNINTKNQQSISDRTERYFKSEVHQIQNQSEPEKEIKLLKKNSEISKTYESYNRISIISDSKKNYKKKVFDINPDFIEIQKIFISKSPIYYDYADVLITHVLISLFATIIPFAPMFCFFFQILSQNARLYIDIFHLKRPTPLSCKNIKIWIQILKINNIIMSFTNCFLYYFYGTANFFVEKKTANKIEIMIFSVEESFFGIICAEHLFIMINFLAQKLISDIPAWVKKEKEDLIGYYQIMSSDKKKKQNLELELKIENYKNNIKKLIQEKKIQNEKMKSFEKNLNIILKQISFNQKKIEEYDDVFDEIKQNQTDNKNNLIDENSKIKIYNKPKIKKLLENKIEKYNDEQLERFDTEKILTTSISQQDKNEDTNIFLSTKKIKKNINIKLDKTLEKAIKEILNQNKITLLTSESEETNIDIIEIYFDFSLKKIFDTIEKIIFQKKFEFFLKNNRSGIVLCTTCSKNKGHFICEECSDVLCSTCKANHDKNEFWLNHKMNTLNLPLKKNLTGRDIIYGMTQTSKNFIKGEKFFFPVTTYQNYGYTNLEKIFDIFYKYYITYNGINQNNSLSLKEYMQYRLEHFTKVESVPEQAFKYDLENIINNCEFNLTEIFFINRICFKNFKYFGAKVTIDKIFEPLKKLQNGEFDEKLKIVLNILDIYDNKIIIKDEMDKFLSACLYHNYANDLSQDKIIENLYPMEAKFMEYNTLYSSIIYKKNIYHIFRNLLQCDDNDEDN